MRSTRKCARSDFSEEFSRRDCYDYGVGILQGTGGETAGLPQWAAFLMISFGLVLKRWLPLHFAMASRALWVGFCWFDLCQTVASKIWHTGLARGITNGHCHRPLHRPALVLLSLGMRTMTAGSNGNLLSVRDLRTYFETKTAQSKPSTALASNSSRARRWYRRRVRLGQVSCESIGDAVNS